jgi:hypothetical protein
MSKRTPDVPKGSALVYEALKDRRWPVVQGYWWREIDLIDYTRQSSAGVQLRKLRARNPGLIIDRWRQSADGRRRWKEFRLSRQYKVV